MAVNTDIKNQILHGLGFVQHNLYNMYKYGNPFHVEFRSLHCKKIKNILILTNNVWVLQAFQDICLVTESSLVDTHLL